MENSGYTSTSPQVISDSQILSAALTQRFGPTILTRVRPDWLTSPDASRLLSLAQRFFRSFQEVPDVAALLAYVSTEEPSLVEVSKQILLSLPPISHPEFFEHQLSERLRGKLLYKAIRDAAALLQEGRYEEIFGLFHKARAESFIGGKAHSSFWEHWDHRDDSLKGSPVPTGFDPLDNLLRGGLYPGEMMLTIGPKSSGKSFFGVWVARAGLFYGKTVAFFTMEMSRSDLLRRIDCSITNFDFDIYQDHREEIKELILNNQNLTGDAHIIEYPSGYPTATILENDLLELEQRLGKKVDCFIVDYIDLMRGAVVGAKGEARFGLISTAVELRGICARNKCAAVVFTQSNALGKRKVFIEAENAAEAYGQTWSADFVISINEVSGRPDQRRIYVADSRRTLKKVSFLYTVDFSAGQWQAHTGF